MLKKFLSIIFVVATVYSSAAQEKPNATADTVYKKILLIPYNPIMHLSDADHDIAEYNQLSVDAIHAAFRHGLLKSVAKKLYGICETQPLVSASSKDMEKDLDMIYGSLNYSMDTVFPVSHPEKDTLRKGKSVFGKSRSTKLKEIHDLKYMNIKLSHPEILKMFSEKYGNNLFVFLNQFEIKTNYDDCLDLSLKIYRRDLKVHYSVFDSSGKQLYGDVVVVNFPSNTNDIKEIMQGNFQKIADYILKTIPRKK